MGRKGELRELLDWWLGVNMCGCGLCSASCPRLKSYIFGVLVVGRGGCVGYAGWVSTCGVHACM